MRNAGNREVKKGRGIICHGFEARWNQSSTGVLIACLLLALSLLLISGGPLMAAVSSATPVPPKPQTATAAPSPAPGEQIGSLYIRQYRVDGGANLISRLQIEEAVYPFLGPGRTENDVEQARMALEKAFRDKGYQTVSVQIPPQQVRGGVVLLQVVEGKIGRLRVKGSRYFLPSSIKKGAPSLAEGTVPDFNKVQEDIVALNQNPDRRVTPVLRAGALPGTVDIDLNVKDSLPLHASLELNNRYSFNTTVLRLNGSLSYDNLWQLGHKIGASFQIAPERLTDAEVFSAYYIAPVPGVNWLSLMAQGTSQNSSVSTLGGLASSGSGTIIGGRALISLPPGKDYYQSLSFGMDYKHFLPTSVFTGPITYYPWSLNYGLTVTGSGSVTELNAGLVFNFRGMGSSPEQFQDRRLIGSGNTTTNNSGDGSFFYFRGDLSRTQDLPGGGQVFAKLQGQYADQQLVDTEQYSGGGLATARGYLESVETSDNAVFGTVELRTPSLSSFLGKAVNEWRFFVFSDNGYMSLYNTGPEQNSHFTLASAGFGSRAQFFDHLNGEIVLGIPLIWHAPNGEGLPGVSNYLITFRVWGEF
jgi:hemolysin activation/secretion protein